MGVGKYSPTIYYSGRKDSDWFEKNGGGFGNGINPESDCDDDGFDSYGYSGKYGDGPDRAGYKEDEYSSQYTIHSHDTQYHLYDRIEDEWRRTNILAIRVNKEKLTLEDPVFLQELRMQRELKAIIEEAQARLAPIEKSIESKLNAEID